MERQHAASLAEKAAQRQLQMRLGQDGLCPSGNAALYGAARASRLCCLALSEELLYRSVLYGWLGMLSEDFRSAEPSAALSLPLALGPAAFSALLFGATFTSYHGEWAVGLSLGVLLQAWAVATSSLLPTVVAHATMELILDGYRRRRPLPKPVRTIPTLSLNPWWPAQTEASGATAHSDDQARSLSAKDLRVVTGAGARSGRGRGRARQESSGHSGE